MKITEAKYGDRWDLLAYDLLGDAALAPALMAANPHLAEAIHIPEGAEIVIPENLPAAPQISSIKPPWQS